MRKKRVICLTTNEIFQSIHEASRKFNLSPTNLRKTCEHKFSYCGKLNGEKLKFEFVDDKTYYSIPSPNKDIVFPKEFKLKYCIYKIICLLTNEIIYIGMTKSKLRTRLIQHYSNLSTYADREMKKYDFNDLKILPIEECNTLKLAQEKETYYTDLYRTKFNLLNIKSGNKFDEITKEKISNALKNKQ